MEEGKGWYVGWGEVVVSNDKGRWVVHYYLKDAAGGADLAVVCREKSLRHMSYAAPAQFLCSVGGWSPAHRPSPPSSSLASPPTATAVAGVSLKWRSRREVIDWLSALISVLIKWQEERSCWVGEMVGEHHGNVHATADLLQKGQDVSFPADDKIKVT